MPDPMMDLLFEDFSDDVMILAHLQLLLGAPDFLDRGAAAPVAIPMEHCHASLETVQRMAGYVN